MSQSILPISQTSNTFDTDPAWSVLASGFPIVANIVHTDPPGPNELVNPGCIIQIATPVDIPQDDSLITISVTFDQTGVESAIKRGVIRVSHPLVIGFIPELSYNSGSEFDIIISQIASVSILASTLFTALGLNYPADSATFFSNNFEIFMALSFGPDSPGEPNFAGTCGIGTYSFLVPNGTPSADVTLILQEDPEGVEEQFTPEVSGGEVAAGGVEVNGAPVNILSVDSSGLYVLTAGKTDDTLYTRNVADSTVDVTIPEPFGTTGPLGD